MTKLVSQNDTDFGSGNSADYFVRDRGTSRPPGKSIVS